MAQDRQTTAPNPTQALLTTTFRLPIRRRIFLRRHKLPVVRLGGNTTKPKRGMFLVRMMRMRWLKLQYVCMMKKIREYYYNLIKDIREASGTLEMIQQRALMETSFAVPVMGVSFSSFPSIAGSDRGRPSVFI